MENTDKITKLKDSLLIQRAKVESEVDGFKSGYMNCANWVLQELEKEESVQIAEVK